MKWTLVCVAGAALATAACSKGEAPDAPATESATGAASADASASPAPEADTSSEAADTAAGDAIPSPVQGTWGINEADCDTSRGDAKGNLKVLPKRLEFYESVAYLVSVKERDTSRIRATFTFEGEGQTWTQDVVLDAQNGGQTLIRRDYGPDALPGPLKYKRCG